MITADFDMTNFNRGVAGLINRVGLESRVVIKKETGELIKTLVKITPKADPQKVRDDITKKFTAVENPGRVFGMTDAAFETKSGVNWYAWNSHALFGVARESDMRGASAEELKPLLYKITKSGRIRGQHGKQRVLIWKRILTSRRAVNRLAAMKIKNIGRLAAGWMVAVFQGGVQLTGSNKPPQKVTRHAAGAKGYFVDGTGTPDKPSFLIANTAKGISGRAVNVLTRAAVEIRAKAMVANTLLFMRGKKNLADYAK